MQFYLSINLVLLCSIKQFSLQLKHRLPVFLFQGKPYRTWELQQESLPLEEHMADLSGFDSFNSALTVYSLQKPIDFHRLHQHFCQLELDQLAALTQQIEASIENTTTSEDGKDSV